jgi:deoxyxylulose-5-phosphate synthase
MVARYHIFKTPRDRLAGDVGHRAYPHKALYRAAGRASGPLRQGGDSSGITKGAEYEYEACGAASGAGLGWP